MHKKQEFIGIPDGYLTVIEVAAELKVGYSSARKYIERYYESGEIEKPSMIKISSGHGTMAIRRDQMEVIRELIIKRKGGRGKVEKVATMEFGFLYLILLVPEFSRTRVKAGFAQNVDIRMTDYLTTNPTAEVLAKLPCKRSWEPFLLAVIESNSKKVRSEVFDITNIDKLIKTLKTLISYTTTVKG